MHKLSTRFLIISNNEKQLLVKKKKSQVVKNKTYKYIKEYYNKRLKDIQVLAKYYSFYNK